VLGAGAVSPWLAQGAHLFLVYSLLALGDLLRHGGGVEAALQRGDLAAARLHREPEREPDGRVRQPDLLVPDRRAAGDGGVQGREHDGLHGRLQDRALPEVRMVRGAPRRRHELAARARDLAAAGPRRAVGTGLLRWWRAAHRVEAARRPAEPEL